MATDRSYFYTLLKAEDDAIRSYDKTLITMSAGGIAVTLGFVSDLFNKQALNSSSYLIVGLGCWAVSIAVTLASFLLSHVAMRRAARLEAAGDPLPEDIEKKTQRLNRAINCSNVISGVVFLGGIIAMLCFVSANLPPPEAPCQGM